MSSHIDTHAQPTLTLTQKKDTTAGRVQFSGRGGGTSPPPHPSPPPQKCNDYNFIFANRDVGMISPLGLDSKQSQGT